MTPDDLATTDLARSGISLEQAQRSGAFVVGDASELLPDFKALPALVLPYIDPLSGNAFTFKRSGEDLPFLRVRYLGDLPTPVGFTKTKALRYGQPTASGVRAYFPRVDAFAWPDVLEDADWPLVLTEGEKKSLAACLQGVPTVGLGGVFNWQQSGDLLPELASVCWEGRTVVICFDSDAIDNAEIQRAEGRLAAELGLSRGADVRFVRLPKGRDGAKVGLDDYLMQFGRAAFITRIEQAPKMRALDAEVLRLNSSVVWVESEGMLFDLESREFIAKADFIKGSRHSTHTLQVPTVKGDNMKTISVADKWLTHPLARRYQKAEFKPGSDLSEDVLNLWSGWDPAEGDVEPFLELTRFLLSEAGEGFEELILNLLAYKVQNPAEKVPLAPILIGEQGCGKSFWAKIVRQMVEPYGAEIPSKALRADFNEYVERTLIGVVNEAQSTHLYQAADVLKALISDELTYMNPKYRPARQVTSYTMYILTSNHRDAANFSGDDRRMIVINCPSKREPEFYARVDDWFRKGGPRKLLGYMLNRDLKGWRPPAAAPVSAEKYMAHVEGQSPVEHLAHEMFTADQNAVYMWVEQSVRWARVAEASGDTRMQAQGRAISDSLGTIHIRPFYTPEELTMMFPAIVGQLHGVSKKMAERTTTGEMSSQLRQAGIPYLVNADDPRGFHYKGRLCQFLVVAAQDEYKQPITQAQFDALMSSFPTYKALQKSLEAAKKIA